MNPTTEASVEQIKRPAEAVLADIAAGKWGDNVILKGAER